MYRRKVSSQSSSGTFDFPGAQKHLMSGLEKFREFEPFLTVRLSSRRSLPSLGLITDIDGTISPIASTPEEARVSPRCRRALRTLAKRLPLVAVISGRPAREAQRMVGLEGLVYMGNHGLERLVGGKEVAIEADAEEYKEAITSVLDALSRKLSIEGIIIENKGVTASIHYRLSSNPAAAQEAILFHFREILHGVSLAELPHRPLKFTEGKMVVDLRPIAATDKGGAVLALLDEYKPEKAIYLGDDLTDVDAFLALRRWAGDTGKDALAVAVLSSETPKEVREKADLCLHGITEVEEFLEWLAEGVKASSS